MNKMLSILVNCISGLISSIKLPAPELHCQH